MELHLKIIGFILVLLSVVHLIFPKYFNWKQELSSLNLINKQLMYVHTFFVALMVLLMGILCICCSADLVHTTLGKQLSFGLFIFGDVDYFFNFLFIRQPSGKAKLLKQWYTSFFRYFGYT